MSTPMVIELPLIPGWSQLAAEAVEELPLLVELFEDPQAARARTSVEPASAALSPLLLRRGCDLSSGVTGLLHGNCRVRGPDDSYHNHEMQQIASNAPVGEALAVPRPLPELDAWNRAFWTGGAEGRLLITRCGGCGYWIHPPGPVCPECLSREVAPQAVSGRGAVLTFTVNHQPWHPAFPPPYVIALVELEEQERLRLVTNLVDCDLGALRSGMPVEVGFEQVEDV